MRLILLSMALFLLAPATNAREFLCPEAYRVIGADAEEQAIIQQLKGAFNNLPAKSPEVTSKANEVVVQALANEALPPTGVTGRTLEASFARLERLYKDMMAIPQVKESICNRYRASKELGFCFGQAMAVHLLSLRQGIDKRSIRKVWLLGELKDQNRDWKFHVATIVRGEGGKWFAIDPLFDRPIELEKWYRLMRAKYDPEKRVRLYATAPGRLLPYGSGRYENSQLDRAVFKNFFRDLFQSMRAADPRMQK